MCGIYVARSAASCHTFAANGICVPPPPSIFLVDCILFAPFLSFRRPPAAQVLKCALFQPRNITAADVQRLRRLLLGLGRTVKSIPLPHNSAFPAGRASTSARSRAASARLSQPASISASSGRVSASVSCPSASSGSCSDSVTPVRRPRRRSMRSSFSIHLLA